MYIFHLQKSGMCTILKAKFTVSTDTVRINNHISSNVFVVARKTETWNSSSVWRTYYEKYFNGKYIQIFNHTLFAINKFLPTLSTGMVSHFFYFFHSGLNLIVLLAIQPLYHFTFDKNSLCVLSFYHVWKYLCDMFIAWTFKTTTTRKLLYPILQ